MIGGSQRSRTARPLPGRRARKHPRKFAPAGRLSVGGGQPPAGTGNEETTLLILPKKTALALLAAAGLTVLPDTAKAQSPRHLDRLARDLERQARDLHREIHTHFRHTPEFRHLARD